MSVSFASARSYEDEERDEQLGYFVWNGWREKGKESWNACLNIDLGSHGNSQSFFFVSNRTTVFARGVRVYELIWGPKNAKASFSAACSRSSVTQTNNSRYRGKPPLCHLFYSNVGKKPKGSHKRGHGNAPKSQQANGLASHSREELQGLTAPDLQGNHSAW